MTPPDASAGHSQGDLRDARLRKIAEIAQRDGLVVEHSGYHEFLLRIDLPLPSGRARVFHINVAILHGDLVASEDPRQARQLPAQCPERHINEDSSFCLYWRDGPAIYTSREEGAVEWLNALISFLQTQIEVDFTRTWPADRAWAHGDAAKHQQSAEAAGGAIGPRFVRWIRSRRLSTARNGLALLLDGKRIAARAKNVYPPRLINRRGLCPCNTSRNGYPITIRRCTHQPALLDIIQELTAMQHRESEVLERLREAKTVCCGTVDDCPLSRAV